IPAPDFADLLLGVAPANELQRHVERFRGAVPPLDAAAAVEVGRDADVVDANQLHRVIDVIDEVLDRRAAGGGPLAIDLGQPLLELGAALWRERVDASCGAATCRAGARASGRRRTGFNRAGARRRGRAAASAAGATAASARQRELLPQRGDRRAAL